LGKECLLQRGGGEKKRRECKRGLLAFLPAEAKSGDAVCHESSCPCAAREKWCAAARRIKSEEWRCAGEGDEKERVLRAEFSALSAMMRCDELFLLLRKDKSGAARKRKI